MNIPNAKQDQETEEIRWPNHHTENLNSVFRKLKEFQENLTEACKTDGHNSVKSSINLR
jgi:hypothetical protein